MSKKTDHNIIVALDLGTSKVVALVGEINDSGRLEIIGLGSYPSRGMKKGVVVNIESTIQSIQRAVEEAELMAGTQIHSVYVGIAGSHVRSLNSHGIVAIKDKEVTDSDVERVMDAARAVAIPADQRILHVLPQEYVIDQQEGIREPVGMSGVRLEARVHLVTAAHSAAQNLVKCVERCGLNVEDIILEQVASSYAVLAEDEKELGVCLVDIGGGTSDIAVLSLGDIVVSSSLRSAGDRLNQDIAAYVKKKYGLLIGEHTAETIKIEIGSSVVGNRQKETQVRGRDVVTGLPKTITLTSDETAEAMNDTIDSMIASAHDVLSETPPELASDIIDRGIVITGGGALLDGISHRFSEVLTVPVMVAETPLDDVAVGSGKLLEHIEELSKEK